MQRRPVPAKHVLRVVLVLLAVGVLYAPVSGAWYCSYDDFTERHRAMFEDAPQPARIFTTAHFVSYMYRPVTSALQWATWKYSHDDPLAFRVRNLFMHLASVALVYGIVLLIVRSSIVALGTALLFGVHPMSNETVVVAIWTNATAYALLFASFFLFLYSIRRAERCREWCPFFGASLACAFIALFTYEPTIIVFALMIGYLAVERTRGVRLPRAYTTVVLISIAGELLLFFGIRHLVIEHGAPFNSPGTILRNALMYVTALVLPADFVLSNVLFGTPLPSELHFTAARAIVPAAATGAALVVAFALVRLPQVRARMTHVDLPALLFFVVAIPLGFLPLLLFREHPSEHDLYPSVAFYAGIICMLVWQLTRSRATYGIIILSLALLFASGTWVRNGSVVRCGAIAKNILTHLPVEDWREGRWHVVLAPAPGQRVSQPYGIYNHTGLTTIEVPGSGVDAAQEAIQIAAQNEAVTVDVVAADAFDARCRNADACFLVTTAGNVSPASPRTERASK